MWPFSKKEKNIKKTEKKVELEERTIDLEEKLDVVEIESITEYESGMVVLKYTNSKDEPCSTKLTRIIPEGGPTDLGPVRK